MSGTQPVFDVPETLLCAELAFSQDELHKRREIFLVRGVHWDYIKKRPLLTRIGTAILRGTRDVTTEALELKNAPAGDSEPVRPIRALLAEFKGELVVCAVPNRNWRLLVTHIPKTEPTNPLNQVSVFVRDNRNFLPGMKLPGPSGGLNRTNETSFDLVGECPRWRGRW